jgi:hypothetical protein
LGDREAEKKGGQYVKGFAEQMFKQLGMRIWVLSTHLDEKGTICVSQ